MTTDEATARAVDLLAKTRALFETTHWAQGHFYKNDAEEQKAKFCAVGGIRYYVIGDPLAGMLEVRADEEAEANVRERIGQDEDGDWGEDLPPEYELAVVALLSACDGLEDVAYRLEDEGFESVEERVYDWNDTAGRTLAEVLDAFQEAQELVGKVGVFV